jgi:hypothetical protein
MIEAANIIQNEEQWELSYPHLFLKVILKGQPAGNL